VYNPFSTLKLFYSKEFREYWYATGTPTFLIDEIKKKNDLGMFIEPQKVIDSTLIGSNSEEIEPVALFFQTGYLTIKKKEYVERKMWYILDFPNYEVESAFLSSLLKEYTFKKEEEVNEINKKIGKALKETDEKRLEESLIELLANIPYDLHIKQEKYYHSLFLIISKLSGYEPEGEEHTDKGRIDVVLRKEEKVIVVEIKYVKEKSSDIESKIKEAIGQIRDRKYYEKYARKEVSLLAIAFGENKEIRCKFENV
jgi:hypothetical protein